MSMILLTQLEIFAFLPPPPYTHTQLQLWLIGKGLFNLLVISVFYKHDSWIQRTDE